jgi:hypothetical protein
MDEATQQLALTLVVFGLPMSLACWVWLASFTGKLAHKTDQPAWFAWLAPRLGATPDRSNAYGVVAMIGLLILFNVAPIGILLEQLWTPGSLLVDLAYFVVQGIIGGSLGLAIRRAGLDSHRT